MTRALAAILPRVPIRAFPDPRRTTREGIVAVGGDLHPDSLILAYRSGIFPWPCEGMPLPWFCPPKRAVLEWDRLHLSRSTRRERRTTSLTLTVDRDFPGVIQGCAAMERPDPVTGELAGTWIWPEVIEGYVALHRRGFAHSVEAWEDGRLVGGVYGVSVDGTFSAESMFRLVPNASKLALIHLVEHCHARGLDWIDVQVMSPHVKALGARDIPRDEFLRRLAETHDRGLRLFDGESAPPAA